ncbi:MAG: hypothetical protein SGCHY_004545 [Lobulomycetales sp.]
MHILLLLLLLFQSCYPIDSENGAQVPSNSSASHQAGLTAEHALGRAVREHDIGSILAVYRDNIQELYRFVKENGSMEGLMGLGIESGNFDLVVDLSSTDSEKWKDCITMESEDNFKIILATACRRVIGDCIRALYNITETTTEEYFMSLSAEEYANIVIVLHRNGNSFWGSLALFRIDATSIFLDAISDSEYRNLFEGAIVPTPEAAVRMAINRPHILDDADNHIFEFIFRTSIVDYPDFAMSLFQKRKWMLLLEMRSYHVADYLYLFERMAHSDINAALQLAEYHFDDQFRHVFDQISQDVRLQLMQSSLETRPALLREIRRTFRNFNPNLSTGNLSDSQIAHAVVELIGAGTCHSAVDLLLSRTSCISDPAWENLSTPADFGMFFNLLVAKNVDVAISLYKLRPRLCLRSLAHLSIETYALIRPWLATEFRELERI